MMLSKRAGRGDLPFARFVKDNPSVGGYFFSDMPQKLCPKGVSAGGGRHRFGGDSAQRGTFGSVEPFAHPLNSDELAYMRTERVYLGFLAVHW